MHETDPNSIPGPDEPDDGEDTTDDTDESTPA